MCFASFANFGYINNAMGANFWKTYLKNPDFVNAAVTFKIKKFYKSHLVDVNFAQTSKES